MLKVLVSGIPAKDAESGTPGSGVTTLAMELSGALAEHVDTHLLIYDKDKSKRGIIESKHKIKLIHINKPGEIHNVIHENGIELIHSVNTGLYLQKNINVPIVQTTWYCPHDLFKRVKNELSRNTKKYPIISDIETIRYNTWAYIVEKLSLRKATRIFAITQALKNQLNKKGWNNVDYVPGPINTELFKPDIKIKKEEQYISILFIGKASHPQKGFKYLLEALKMIVSQTKQKIVLKLAGTIDPIFLNEINKICTVDYKGVIPRHRLPEIYLESDIFVFPSLYEEFGYVALEAMSCGTPVVATKTHSMFDIVGDAGILVPIRDSNALANALITLIEDTQLRSKLGNEARKRVVALFSWNTISQKNIEIYSSLL